MFTGYFKLQLIVTAFKATINQKISVNVLVILQIILIHFFLKFLTSLFILRRRCPGNWDIVEVRV